MRLLSVVVSFKRQNVGDIWPTAVDTHNFLRLFPECALEIARHSLLNPGNFRSPNPTSTKRRLPRIVGKPRRQPYLRRTRSIRDDKTHRHYESGANAFDNSKSSRFEHNQLFLIHSAFLAYIGKRFRELTNRPFARGWKIYQFAPKRTLSVRIGRVRCCKPPVGRMSNRGGDIHKPRPTPSSQSRARYLLPGHHPRIKIRTAVRGVWNNGKKGTNPAACRGDERCTYEQSRHCSEIWCICLHVKKLKEHVEMRRKRRPPPYTARWQRLAAEKDRSLQWAAVRMSGRAV